jgi:membrane fusion protein (multidrug efflux system)
MQTNKLNSLISIILLSTLMIACASKGKNAKETGSIEATGPSLPVDIKVVQETSIQQTEIVAGSIVPNRTVDIMSELSKKVSQVFFKDGSYVTQGQALYKLDDADVIAKLRQLNAELNLAKISEIRLRELLKTETVRQEEYDIALAKLQSLEAAQELLQVELSKTAIRAPFSGAVGFTKVYPGTLVSPGMPMATLQDQGMLKIQFTVSEKYLPIIKPGNTIEFSTELDDQRLAAKVTSTEAAVDVLSRNITVQAVTPNAGNMLKPGMSVKVYFNVSANNAKGIKVPTESLIPSANGYSVFVIKNGHTKITPVTIANRNDQEALLREGLQHGDTIMISNILRASDGIPVAIVSSN